MFEGFGRFWFLVFHFQFVKSILGRYLVPVNFWFLSLSLMGFFLMDGMSSKSIYDNFGKLIFRHSSCVYHDTSIGEFFNIPRFLVF